MFCITNDENQYKVVSFEVLPALKASMTPSALGGRYQRSEKITASVFRVDTLLRNVATHLYGVTTRKNINNEVCFKLLVS
jgi:hypothetical protein